MRGAGIMKSGGMAAFVAVLTLVTVPANAQERGEGRGRGGDRPAAQGGASPRGSNWRGSNGGGGGGGDRAMGWRNGGQPQAQRPAEPVAGPAQVRTDRRDGDGNGNWQGRRGVADGTANLAPRGDDARWRGNGEADRRRGDDTANRWRSDSASADRWRNADAANRWRSDTVDANRWRGDRQNYAWRGDRADYGWRGERQNWAGNGSGNWNRDWRRDNRYDWRGYRSANRDVYRLGAYYAPYRGYSYRRLTAGIQLDALFFGSRYWIDDPWQYRLPPAEGPYRWVRYYDDALLVDTYSGEVVDVLYDFFW